MEPSTKPTPDNPLTPALAGVGLLFASILLGQSRDADGLVYLGRFLFLAGLGLVGWAVAVWYRQTREPEQEREPEV